MKKIIEYNCNLLKGGAVLDDIKILLKHWRNDTPQKVLTKELILKNVLGKKSRKRTADVIRYIFLPRYINGYPKNHWIYLKKLVEANVAIDIIKPLLYFFSALNEPLIFNFVLNVILPRYKKGILEVDTQDTFDYIRLGIKDSVILVKWSESVIKRVASGLFASLKEFGIIEGGKKRKVAFKLIPLPVFYYIAYFMYKKGITGRKIINHDYWKLFLLNQEEVERLFMETHQQKYLHYEEIGDLVRLDFFNDSFEEIVNVVIERAD